MQENININDIEVLLKRVSVEILSLKNQVKATNDRVDDLMSISTPDSFLEQLKFIGSEIEKLKEKFNKHIILKSNDL